LATEADIPDILQEILKWTKNKLISQEINKFLLAIDHERMIAWHVVSRRIKPEILQNIWELTEENLTKEEINNKLLFATDYKGRTVLHLAALNKEIEVLQKLRVWAKEKLTAGNVIKKLLFARYHNGRTVWKITTGLWRPISLQKLWE